MTLGKKQELFMRLLPSLINKAHALGFEVRGGDLFRDPRIHGAVGIAIADYLNLLFPVLGRVKFGYGHKNSCHKLKLAIDLNLMLDGRLVSSTEGHRKLGEWWENQHELCRWGGRFKTPDGNHYSIFHNGSS